MSNDSPSQWSAISALAETVPDISALRQSPERGRDYILSTEGLRVDITRQRMTDNIRRAMIGLAAARNMHQWRKDMFEGKKINTSEGRAVLHTALRSPSSAQIFMDGTDIVPGIHATLDRMRIFCDSVHAGHWCGHTGRPIKSVVNIGIGGSDLGPRMVCDALRQYHTGDIAVHFVSNVDGHDLWPVLQSCVPDETLFVISSKTFTTTETMMNARTAREWLVSALGSDSAIHRHAVAVSANPVAAHDFGINPDHVFSFNDWVGGRFSVWSSIGLSVALCLGFDHFRAFLDGAHAMDTHFRDAPDDANIPLILGLCDIWNRNFLGAAAHAVLPYDHRMRLFSSWLQQLAMESNGKSVNRDRQSVDYSTSPVVFGTPGTDCQHSFMQMVHQGTDMIPCDFIAVQSHDHPWPEHHRMLLVNMAAQADALADGRSLGHSGNDPQRSFPGNRPSTTLILERMDPYHLGLLMALYEHRIFVQGVLWSINSFDQFGVELGKELANQMLKG